LSMSHSHLSLSLVLSRLIRPKIRSSLRFWLFVSQLRSLFERNAHFRCSLTHSFIH
jgi:hypothetical protein